MTRKQIKPSDLKGISIYQDPKKGTVFYDFVTKNAYIITSGDIKTYTLYSNLLLICLAVSYLISTFFQFDLTKTIILFLALYILGEIAFRIFFFKNLYRIENYKPYKKDNIVLALAKNYSSNRIIILTLLLLALTILMPLNAIISNLDDVNKYVSYAISIVTAIGVIISLSALYIKKKNNY